MLAGREGEVATLAAAFAAPGLTVVAGPAGIGKTALVRAAAERIPLVATGGLATLRHRPGLPLTRALRAPVPPDDVPLAAEAVRVRLRDRLLLVDDLQWADPYTLAVLAVLADSMRIVATTRVPVLRSAATTWLDVPPLPDDAAAALVLSVAPGIDPASVVARAGGNPLALLALARSPSLEGGSLAATTAAGIAELPRDARTSLAALGLLGRPVPAGLLGPGGAALVSAGLALADGELLRAREPYVAEVAAGVLPADVRRAMHARLGALLPDDVEAARHLAAAGDAAGASARARAASTRGTLGERAAALLLAASVDESPEVVLAAATACAAAGLTGEVRRLLEDFLPPDATARVHRASLLASALVDAGRSEQAAALLESVAAEVAAGPPEVGAEHAVVSVRAALASDPDVACALAEYALASGATAPALRAAHAAALRAAGRPGWDEAARGALAAARAAGDPVAERLAGAALVAGLRETFRVADARVAAESLAAVAAEQAAYSAEVAFRAEALWAALHVDGDVDAVVRDAGALADRAAPYAARALLTATLALAYADGGSLPTARALLGRAGPVARDRTVRWVAAEAAWLDGDADSAGRAALALAGAGDLASSLAALTAVWSGQPDPGGAEEPAAGTLAALHAQDPAGLAGAAEAWTGVMARERVRCLLGAGLAGPLPPLLEAEALAEGAGLATLLGRVRRALRTHGVVRRPAAAPGSPLSPREREVLGLVGQGLSTRRIAELLGVTRHTAETYVKQGMAKLGARTRTEAAVRAAALDDPIAAGS